MSTSTLYMDIMNELYGVSFYEERADIVAYSLFKWYMNNEENAYLEIPEDIKLLFKQIIENDDSRATRNLSKDELEWRRNLALYIVSAEYSIEKENEKDFTWMSYLMKFILRHNLRPLMDYVKDAVSKLNVKNILYQDTIFNIYKYEDNNDEIHLLFVNCEMFDTNRVNRNSDIQFYILETNYDTNGVNYLQVYFPYEDIIHTRNSAEVMNNNNM